MLKKITYSYKHKLWKLILSSGSIFLLISWISYAQVCSIELEEQEEFDPSPVWTGFHDNNLDGVYNSGDVYVSTIDGRETTLIWDIDGDGMPEVIVDDYKKPARLRVFDGETWAVEHEILTDIDLTNNNSSNLIADTDGNGYGEIYLVDRSKQFYRFDFDGTTFTETWMSPDLAQSIYYVPHIADFDGDGTPEIHMGTQIFRVSDGKKIIDGWFNPGDLWWSVAADMLPASSSCTDCAGQELVMWSKIFAVNMAASTMTEVRFDGLPWHASSRYATSVADMDNDGDLDVVYSARSVDSDARVAVRDGQTNTVMMTHEVNDFNAGLWRVNIADFDGDGINEMWVVSYAKYNVVDDVVNFPWWADLRWIKNSDTSAVTSSSVFDFDYDGKSEVVYRDMTDLYILDGAEWIGTTVNSAWTMTSYSVVNPSPVVPKFKEPCISWTRWENPTIADINNDGQTEIAVICANGWWNRWNGRVKTFASASDPRAPSRPVWNQHGYNITNVNDDLTIPAVPKNNATREWWVHNTFLTQSLPIDSNFVLTNSFLPPGHIYAADAQVEILATDASQCSVSMSLDLEVSNLWDALLPASTPIVIYDDDPSVFASTAIWSTTLGTVLWTGWASTTLTVPVSDCISPVYVVVNDGTTSSPYALTWTTLFPNTSTAECTYLNNIDSQTFSYCGDGLLDSGEECDDPKICADGSFCSFDIDCDTDITDWLVMHHQFQWWSLVDLSGNGNDGLLQWDAKIVNWLTDESVSFDGYDDRMLVPHSASLDLTSNITVAARVYPRDFAHGQWAWDFSAILTKGAAYYLNLNASWHPQFYRYGLSNEGYHTSPNPLPLHERSHVAATYDSSAWMISVYVNGVLEVSAPSTWNGTQNTQDVGIWRYPWSDVRELDGVIDDARVYDRPLSQTEVAQLVENWRDVCVWNTDSGDGCSDLCEIEYCRDDAPLHDTSKNFVITAVSPTTVSWTSSQPNSKVTICLEDTMWTRDIVFTTTDPVWTFTSPINLWPYTAPWVNVWVMLHNEDGLDIDHHAMVILN